MFPKYELYRKSQLLKRLMLYLYFKIVNINYFYIISLLAATDTGYILKEYSELNLNTRVVSGSFYFSRILDDIFYPGTADYKVSDSQAEDIGVLATHDLILKYLVAMSGISNPPGSLPQIRRIRYAPLSTNDLNNSVVIGDTLLKLRGFGTIVVGFPKIEYSERKLMMQLIFAGIRKHGIFLISAFQN